MSECTICAEKYNKSTRKRVGCEYCEFEACQTCVRTYLLDKPEPKCMNNTCDRIWTRKFLVANLPIAFINKEYRPHLANVQFELEKSRLPNSQITLELENRITKLNEEEENIKKEIELLRARIFDIQLERTHVKSRVTRRYRGEQDLGAENEGEGGAVAALQNRFTRACPSNDCRGYLSTQWKCGTCEQYTCPDCHEVKGPRRDVEHVCNPDTVASVQSIAKDTKNCPNCRATIYRIAGCNHMFCTACNTGFDWKTNKIIRGSVGNPHYYEYIANRNAAAGVRQVLDAEYVDRDACNDIMEMTRKSGVICNVISAFNRRKIRFEPLVRKCIERSVESIMGTHEWPFKASGYNASDWISRSLRCISHNEDVLLSEVFSDNSEFESMEKLRIKYLRKEINDEQFCSLIQKHTHKVSMNREYRHILEMANQVMKDIIARMIRELLPHCNEINAYLRANMPSNQMDYMHANNVSDAHMRALYISMEYNSLREYVNELARDVTVTYRSSAMPYQLNDYCEFIHIRKER